MDKDELRRQLEAQVQQKLADGYEVVTYALDAASRDKVRRELKPHGHALPHDNPGTQAWEEFLLEASRGKSDLVHVKEPDLSTAERRIQAGVTAAGKCGTSPGLWRTRRH